MYKLLKLNMFSKTRDEISIILWEYIIRIWEKER
jgi:hypothetical protein